jgi:hypothetical protein
MPQRPRGRFSSNLQFLSTDIAPAGIVVALDFENNPLTGRVFASYSVSGVKFISVQKGASETLRLRS